MAMIVSASSSPFKKRKLIIPTFMQKVVEVPAPMTQEGIVNIPMSQEEIVNMPNTIQQESITQQHDEHWTKQPAQGFADVSCDVISAVYGPYFPYEDELSGAHWGLQACLLLALLVFAINLLSCGALKLSIMIYDMNNNVKYSYIYIYIYTQSSDWLKNLLIALCGLYSSQGTEVVLPPFPY